MPRSSNGLLVEVGRQRQRPLYHILWLTLRRTWRRYEKCYGRHGRLSAFGLRFNNLRSVGGCASRAGPQRRSSRGGHTVISTELDVCRAAVQLSADPKRVMARSFIPGGPERVTAILDRVLRLPAHESSALLDSVLLRYGDRHKNLKELFERHYEVVAPHLNGNAPSSEHVRQLIGSYFTCEYSLECVALFNPSVVPHPDQSGLPADTLRFVMSLRACGEGHISSVEFRSGTVAAPCTIELDAISRFASAERRTGAYRHDRNRFFLKLKEIEARWPRSEEVLRDVAEQFTADDLADALERLRPKCHNWRSFDEMANAMLWVARSNYQLEFPPDSDLAERVIFPLTDNENRGIEDARFVCFTDAGHSVYYGTCTAYNGVHALPQLIETTDFRRFRVATLNGRCSRNKGMALFPRKIADRYAMVSRIDGENMYILRSDDILFWNEAEMIQQPVQPWESVQIGNCGSPIETAEGWLVLTHGVGPMREYRMGAMLLDLDDPSRVIGALADPLLIPSEDQRDGYVPNVVYSCGGLVHCGQLVIPYGMADTSTGVAHVPVDDVLAQIRRA